MPVYTKKDRNFFELHYNKMFNTTVSLQRGSAERLPVEQPVYSPGQSWGWSIAARWTRVLQHCPCLLSACYLLVVGPCLFVVFCPSEWGFGGEKNTDSKMLQHFLESFLPTFGLKLHFWQQFVGKHHLSLLLAALMRFLLCYWHHVLMRVRS